MTPQQTKKLIELADELYKELKSKKGEKVDITGKVNYLIGFIQALKETE